MKNTRKKGFTIVELVIVIAVIAILAAVLIPTFSNVISRANSSAAMQEARSVWYEYVASLSKEDLAKLNTYTGTLEYGGYHFEIKNGTFTSVVADTVAATVWTTDSNGAIPTESQE